MTSIDQSFFDLQSLILSWQIHTTDPPQEGKRNALLLRRRGGKRDHQEEGDAESAAPASDRGTLHGKDLTPEKSEVG